MDDCIDTFGDAQIVPTLNSNYSYQQKEMVEKGVDKTAFVTRLGQYWCKRMPFGLENVAAIFQMIINIILASVKWQCAIVYIDDVIIFSKALEEHVTHIEEDLRLLNASEMSLELKKCHFFFRVDWLFRSRDCPGQAPSMETNNNGSRRTAILGWCVPNEAFSGSM